MQNDLDKALGDIDFAIASMGNKDIFTAYNRGKNALKPTVASDLDVLYANIKAFSDYYRYQIQELPESQKNCEILKITLIENTLTSIINTSRSSSGLVNAPPLFQYYILGYVSRLINR